MCFKYSRSFGEKWTEKMGLFSKKNETAVKNEELEKTQFILPSIQISFSFERLKTSKKEKTIL